MKLQEVCEIYYGQKMNRYKTLEGENTVRVPVYSYYETETSYTVVKKEDENKLPRTKEGMVLLNASSHRAELVTKTQKNKVIPANFIVLEPKNIDPNYLTWHVNNDHYFKHQLQKAIQGSSITIISVQLVKNLVLRLPDQKTQEWIGAMVELKDKKMKLTNEREMLMDQILKHTNREGI